MWYFAWVLGLGFACAFSIMSALWLELQADDSENEIIMGDPESEARERA